MKILSQTNDLSGFHGRVGLLTPYKDYNGKSIHVGDLVIVCRKNDITEEFLKELLSEPRDDYGEEFSPCCICEHQPFVADFFGKEQVGCYISGWLGVNPTIEQYNILIYKKYTDIPTNFKLGFISMIDINDNESITKLNKLDKNISMLGE